MCWPYHYTFVRDGLHTEPYAHIFVYIRIHILLARSTPPPISVPKYSRSHTPIHHHNYPCTCCISLFLSAMLSRYIINLQIHGVNKKKKKKITHTRVGTCLQPYVCVQGRTRAIFCFFHYNFCPCSFFLH